MGDFVRGRFGGRGQGRGRGRGRHHGGRRFHGGRSHHHQGRGGGRFHNHRGGRQGGDRSIPHEVSNDPIEIIGNPTEKSVNIAIEGCCHGELDKIYERLEAYQKESGQTVDMLICCGDFQSLRNPADFHSCSIPPKYQRLGTFPQYYSGDKVAPILTLFIGGNHEASQPLRELHYGGWAAPNIYYMGAAGVVQYGGLRIGGVSGIYKSHDYVMGQYEKPPFDRSSLRSVYHVRNVDVHRMKCLSHDNGRVDVFASHDWPLGIEQHGDTQGLIRRKPFFREEIERNDLGSPPNREILDVVQPRYWFAAHLHVKFQATVDFSASQDKESPGETTAKDPSLILVPSQVTTRVVAEKCQEQDGASSNADSEEKVNTSTETHFVALESKDNCSGPDLTDLMTKFLALDKCLPRRQYLSILHVDSEVAKADRHLEYDAEWLAVVKKTHNLTSPDRRRIDVPQELENVTNADMEWVESRLNELNGGKTISTEFDHTVPLASNSVFQRRVPPLPNMGNPQTDKLLQMLDLDHVITVPYDESLTVDTIVKLLGGVAGAPVQPEEVVDDNEIDIDIDDDDQDEKQVQTEVAPAVDENEIALNDESLPDDTGIVADGTLCDSSRESAPLKKARIETIETKDDN
eukprot:Nitzschia sp. Nitz4//scaffold61_size107673//105515//107511//NITZ4_004259-RA/size107673-snap-gene-0.105-mRNA-1//1//CDS//3329555782//7965//frame0